MTEGRDAIDRIGEQCLSLSLHCRGNIVDTAYRGNNPDFIPDAGAPIASAEALEKPLFCGRNFRMTGGVLIGQLLAQAGLHVVGMDPFSRPDRPGSKAHGRRILDDKGSSRYLCKGKFMPLGNVLLKGDCSLRKLNDRAGFERLQRHCNSIRQADPDKLFHAVISPFLLDQKLSPAPSSGKPDRPYQSGLPPEQPVPCHFFQRSPADPHDPAPKCCGCQNRLRPRQHPPAYSS